MVAHLFDLWRNRHCEIRLYGIRHACIMFSLYLLTRVVCYWSHIRFAQRTYWWWLPPLVEPSLLWELVLLSLASHERRISQSHVVVFCFYAVVDKANISRAVVVVRKWWWWLASVVSCPNPIWPYACECTKNICYLLFVFKTSTTYCVRVSNNNILFWNRLRAAQFYTCAGPIGWQVV